MKSWVMLLVGLGLGALAMGIAWNQANRRLATKLFVVSELIDINERVDAIGSRLDPVEERVFEQVVEGMNRRWASLDHVDGAPRICQSPIGPLVIRLVDIRPVAGGQRVILEIGNPTAADLDGLFVSIRYSFEDDEATRLAHKAEGKDHWMQRSFEVVCKSKLLASAWTPVDFVIPELDQKALLPLSVKVTPQYIVLKNSPVISE